MKGISKRGSSGDELNRGGAKSTTALAFPWAAGDVVRRGVLGAAWCGARRPGRGGSGVAVLVLDMWGRMGFRGAGSNGGRACRKEETEVASEGTVWEEKGAQHGRRWGQGGAMEAEWCSNGGAKPNRSGENR